MEEARRKVDRLNKQHSKVVLPAEGGVIVTPQRPQTMDKASWVWRLIYDIWLYFFPGYVMFGQKIKFNSDQCGSDYQRLSVIM